MRAYSTVFFLTLPFSTLNTHDQTIEITISRPDPPANDLPDLQYPSDLEEDSDIVISEPDLEHDEDVTIVSYGPAPGLPGSTVAFPQASDDSDMESDEDISFVGFGPEPGPSRSMMAMPQANDDNVLSESEPEIDADSEDIVVTVSLFHLSSRSGSFSGSRCQQAKQQDSDAGQAAASGVKNRDIKQEH
jgi:hypothetical protein